MKPKPVAISLLSIVLAACSAQQPAAPTQPATMPEPAAVATAAPPAEGTPMTIFRAFGNEPFWNIRVEGNTLTLTTPDDQQGMVMQGTHRTPPGGAEITGSHDGKPFALTVTAVECGDGMSDNQYQLVSSFRHGDINYTGCGELAK